MRALVVPRVQLCELFVRDPTHWLGVREKKAGRLVKGVRSRDGTTRREERGTELGGGDESGKGTFQKASETR